jgi:hypothetical protein
MRLLVKTTLFLFSAALGYFAAGCDGDDTADDDNGVVCEGDPSTGDSDGDGICDSDDPCPLELIWEGNYVITDAASTEALADYAEITGSLMIDPDVEQIEGPACLERIDGDLTMQGNGIITELSGFESLREVGGHVALSHNESLVTLDVAGAPLVSIGGCILIIDNGSMTEVNLPPSLETVGGDVYFFSNPLVQSLVLPDAISAIGGDLLIQGNLSLTAVSFSSPSWEVVGDLSIDAMTLDSLDLGNGLTSVGGSLILSAVADTMNLVLPDSLTSVGANIQIGGASSIHLPAGLETIGGSLLLGGNSLQEIDFPTSLATIGADLSLYMVNGCSQIMLPVSLAEIGGNFQLINNSTLTTISAPGLESVLGILDIDGNSTLPTCQATALRDQLSEVGGACIQNNAVDECEDDLSGC